MKPCPYCKKEDLHDAARRCPYCGTWLTRKRRIFEFSKMIAWVFIFVFILGFAGCAGVLFLE